MSGQNSIAALAQTPFERESAIRRMRLGLSSFARVLRRARTDDGAECGPWLVGCSIEP